MSKARVRFAPSPTGSLHVGGARTALYNYLFARHHGGRFVVRVEDTDVLRNIEGAEEQLLDDLRWLGLDWDEGPAGGGDFGPYRQSERRAGYDAARDCLLEAGLAYHAFDTPEGLDAFRREAQSRKENFRYPRPDPLPTAEDVARAREQGRPVVVRFKTPAEPIAIRDEILGEVEFPADQIDDFVIVKANGWPTYHLAVVVDDAAMKITHVLRAQEHLMNTPKHVLLQRALGYETPRFAHLPLVFNSDGSKMSKRDKHKAVRQATRDALKQQRVDLAELEQAAGLSTESFERWLKKKADAELDGAGLERLAARLQVELPEIDVADFRRSGYLPEALANFVALIGWSPGGDREKMSLDEMAEAFTVDRVNKTSGRFDRDKLLALNTQWAAGLDEDRLLAAFRDWIAVSGSPLASLDDATAAHLLRACAGFRTFADVERKSASLFAADDTLEFDAKAVRKVLESKDGRGYATLASLLQQLEALPDWNAEALQQRLTAFCEANDAKLKDVAQPLRVAVSGGTISPAIYDTLVLLGRERTLARVRRCIERREETTP